MSMVWGSAVSVVQKAQQLEKPPLIFTLFLAFIFFWVIRKKRTQGIPPGTFGWPFIGETLQFLGCQRRGSPQEFFDDRTQKYGNVFTTSLVGHPTVALCSAEGNRFLFSNENKLVVMSWPSSMAKFFGSSLLNATGDDSKRLRRMLMTFLRPEALQKFVGRVDSITKQHLAEHWMGKSEVTVFPLMKRLTFSLACDLFATINDHDDAARFSHQFMVLLKGLLQIPIDLPGTRYSNAKRAANAIRELLDGHDTSSSTLSVLFKFLAENPHCYQQVFKEQQDIARSKEAGQRLEWEDLQKMKYSWSTAQEALRLLPPVQGGFRKAIKDFKYGGYTVPRGWKMYWTVNSTHRKSQYFSDPEKFDPSRFEGSGPAPYTFVPFGGGPRMCPGIEFARMEILVFLHYAVRNFKWTLVDPSEKMTMDPMTAPVNGLPIKLFPH